MGLETIWFFLWGLLWAVFFMTDGFDFGVGTLLPFLGKTDQDRRVMVNSLGPLWDGNEVWLIAAGGVTFAAFPMVYAVMFSSLYTPLMLILFALILRGVSFEFRHQVDSPSWKKLWDGCIFIGSFLPALLFGVAFANIFKGLPIDGNGILQGNLFTLLNPYGLLGGALFVALFLVHGALWLAFKSEGDLNERSGAFAGKAWVVLLIVAVLFLLASYFYTPLYENYFAKPVLFAVPGLAVLALLATRALIAKKAWFAAWAASAVTIVSCTFFGIIGLFPNLFPSNLNTAACGTYNAALSLTANNAASSPLTLKIMLGVTLVFIPIVIVYQAWAYKLFSHKITEENLADHPY